MGATMRADGLADLGQVVRGSVGGPGGAPGLVALVCHEGRRHAEVAGRLALDGAAVERDSLFRIASMTKPVTGAATLALVAEDLLALDEPIGSLLPELAEPRVLRQPDGPLEDTVAANRPITVRDLLTFTFGFGMAFDMFMAPEPWPVVTAATTLNLSTLGPPNPDIAPDPDTWIARLGSIPLIAQPGERWLYNTGAQVLGVLLARAAGMTFGDVLRTRIFEPLGMSDTSFHTTESDRLATAYTRTTDGLRVWDPPDGQWSRPPSFCDGAAGLVSTADDMASFALALLGGGPPILGPDAVAEMSRDQLTDAQKAGITGFLDGQSWGFCQAVTTEGPHAGAFGWNGGLGTSWLVDPSRQLAVVVLTQRMFDGPALPPIHQAIQDAAYAAIG
jgi:CubicO group peptidase (beta-lactamase class C family)